jgi:hypothetical protein
VAVDLARRPPAARRRVAGTTPLRRWPVSRTTAVGLLVDAANVVGSRPDGWWRDRAGAPRGSSLGWRPVPGTAVAGHPVDEVVVVLEGWRATVHRRAA